MDYFVCPSKGTLKSAWRGIRLTLLGSRECSDFQRRASASVEVERLIAWSRLLLFVLLSCEFKA